MGGNRRSSFLRMSKPEPSTNAIEAQKLYPLLERAVERLHLEEDVLTPSNAAKLAWALSFASSVLLPRLGRPFLHPL